MKAAFGLLFCFHHYLRLFHRNKTISIYPFEILIIVIRISTMGYGFFRCEVIRAVSIFKKKFNTTSFGAPLMDICA